MSEKKSPGSISPPTSVGPSEATFPAGKRLASLEELQAMAKTLRRHIIEMTSAAASGHPGGSLSAVEILTTLYFRVLRYRPAEPQWPDRDRFILSKGHAAPLLYSVLAEVGCLSTEEICTLRKIDSRLQGHPDKLCTPGLEATSGSLGQGLSIGIGIALAGRLDAKSYRVYVLLGDGECDEGQVWEAAMAAAHFKLDSIVGVVDHNGLQIDGWNKDVMNLEPLPDKWRSFGWNVIEVDGHDFTQILAALEQAERVKGQPTMIIAHTVKGKGVSFMENKVDFHGKAPTREEAEKALRELA
jgi:transketolase